MSPFLNSSSSKARSRAAGLRRGFGTVDTLLLVGGAALLAWGGLYLGRYNGRFDVNEFDEIPHGRAPKAVAVAADPNAAVLKAGSAVYNKTCVNCHMADGNGRPEAPFFIPPLAGSDWILAESPNRIARIALHGLNGPVKVKDAMYQGGVMNPQGQSADNPGGLSNEEIANVLSYVRNSWGNKASLITAAQVEAVAKEVGKRADPWTMDELMKVPMTGGSSASAAITPDQLKAALKVLPAAELEAVLKEVKK